MTDQQLPTYDDNQHLVATLSVDKPFVYAPVTEKMSKDTLCEALLVLRAVSLVSRIVCRVVHVHLPKYYNISTQLVCTHVEVIQ